MLALIALISFTSCKNYRVKQIGGTMTIELPANQKFVNATWKDNNLWYITTEMEITDKPKTHVFKEKSNNNIFEGKVIFKETR